MQTLSWLSRGANAEGVVKKQKQALKMIMAVITQPATQTKSSVLSGALPAEKGI